MVTTRTIGPLHFEDLEPHRFEDLVRQLVYDFRNWNKLEATGRGGSDDGFDVRGIEYIPSEPVSADDSDSSDNDADEGLPDEVMERVWLIQCKRERTITPKKLRKYLDGIAEDERNSLYGIIFVAACDFSKAAHDVFREKAREFGFGEAYLWGKGEIEDQLFQPKNDHLLFAYMGISLQTRRRSLRTNVRQRLATKRKASKLGSYIPVLIRDAAEDRYPYLDQDEKKDRIDRGRWKPFRYLGCFHDGLHFLCMKQFAFIDDDGVAWDFAEKMDDGPIGEYENPWFQKADDDEDDRPASMAIWNELPEVNRGWLEMIAVLPFDAILDIDFTGDEFFKGPHIYTIEFDRQRGPFKNFFQRLQTISTWNARSADPDEENRVVKFPR